MKRTGSTNYILRRTIRQLKSYAAKYNANIWRYIAELLELPTRRKIVVNLSKINRYTKDGDIVIVPGKVLGAGVIEHRVVVVAPAFSQQAINKIKVAGGRAIHILEFLRENPRGNNVKVIR